ncbi:hypothetical protein RFI_24003, partial [Reticulomyxa filosa]
MQLYVRGTADVIPSNMHLIVLQPGQIIPLHGIFNFFFCNKNNSSFIIFFLIKKKNKIIIINRLRKILYYTGTCHHQLMALINVTPRRDTYHFRDGVYLYDPRGSVSGYGYAGGLVKLSQHVDIQLRSGEIVVFPSQMQFMTLPVPYKRYFVVMHSDLAPVANAPNLATNKNPKFAIHSRYSPGNDKPFFDDHISYFTTFGTPIYRNSILNELIHGKTSEFDLLQLSRCILLLRQHSQS